MSGVKKSSSFKSKIPVRKKQPSTLSQDIEQSRTNVQSYQKRSRSVEKFRYENVNIFYIQKSPTCKEVGQKEYKNLNFPPKYGSSHPRTYYVPNGNSNDSANFASRNDVARNENETRSRNSQQECYRNVSKRKFKPEEVPSSGLFNKGATFTKNPGRYNRNLRYFEKNCTDTELSSIGGTSGYSDDDATSSSDESVDSDIFEQQPLLYTNADTIAIQSSEDAFSLNDLLDSVPSGSFSCESLVVSTKQSEVNTNIAEASSEQLNVTQQSNCEQMFKYENILGEDNCKKYENLIELSDMNNEFLCANKNNANSDNGNFYETIKSEVKSNVGSVVYETMHRQTKSIRTDLKYSDNCLSDVYYIKFKPSESTTLSSEADVKDNEKNITSNILLVQSDAGYRNKNDIIVNVNAVSRKLTVANGGHIEMEKTEKEVYSSALGDSTGSLDCPPPPSPPSARRGPMGRSPETRNDPQARLVRYLRALYREWGMGETPLPAWAPPVPPGVLCPAHYQPELRLMPVSAGAGESINVDQLLTAVKIRDGSTLDPPRRVLVVGPPGLGRNALSLRVLHAWASEPRWPQRGPAVALTVFVPLAELKGSLEHFVCKELLPKISPSPSFLSNPYSGFPRAWNTLSGLGTRLLFLLDGYDLYNAHQGKVGTQGDVIDLLEGRLFPEARVIVTSSPSFSAALSPLMQRRVSLEGLSWSRIEQLLGGHSVHLVPIIQKSTLLQRLAREPLGWLALSVLNQEHNKIPNDELEFIESLLKCLLTRSLLSKTDSYVSRNVFGDMRVMADFGRLALNCVNNKREVFYDQEIREYCKGRGVDATDLGFLNRTLLFSRSARKKNAYIYTPICQYFIHLLCAYYLVSIVHYSGVLKAELNTMINTKIDDNIVKILQFTMGLLGWKSYLVFKQLCPLMTTPKLAFELIKSAGQTEANVAALCELVGGKVTQTLQHSNSSIQIRTSDDELQGWKLVLQAKNCNIKSIEIVFQLDHNLESLDEFLNVLNENESIDCIKISSLIEHDVKEEEIASLTEIITAALTKKRIQAFELILTLLEDTSSHRFQPLVNNLCLSLPVQSSLNKLVLDFNLSSNQLGQLCAVLEIVTNVKHLHLPHLCCDKAAILALSGLLNTRPLVGLSLAGSWGGREDPPSSSGVSMGSGSGSSSGASGHLVKQNSLTGNPSPKTFTSALTGGGHFSSLPRGMMAPWGSLNRSSTLPRQPIQTFLDSYIHNGHNDTNTYGGKRNSDSLISRHFYPVPMCDSSVHSGSGFHDLFMTARDSKCNLNNLNVSKCQMALEDSMCLGETVRFSKCLDSLRMEGATRLSEVLPSILGVAESRTIKLLDLSSQRIILEDSHMQLVFQSLSKNCSLKLISLEGWTFRIENPLSLLAFPHFLEQTTSRDLVLTNCRLHLALYDQSRPSLTKNDVTPAALLAAIPPFKCDTVVFLRLGCCQVTVNDHLALTGPLLLPFLKGFRCLRDLDLSIDRNNIISNVTTPQIINDKIFTSFFLILATNFKLLQCLNISNWKIVFEDAEKCIKSLTKSLKNINVSHFKMAGTSFTDRSRKHNFDYLFIISLITNLSQLCYLNLGGLTWTKANGGMVGDCIRERYQNNVLDVGITDSHTEGVREFVRTLSLGGKFKVSVFNVGSNGSCCVRAQCAETKTKSIKRRTSMKN